MSKLIPLHGKNGRGKFAIVDENDYPYLSAFRWRCAHGYPVRSIKVGPDKYLSQGMHNEIMKPPPGFQVDHHDQNCLNMTRTNLRLATFAQNGQNKKQTLNNKSGYKGVSWLKRDQLWTVWICLDGRNLYVDSYRDLHEAGAAYNEAAKLLFGEFAWLNPVPEDTKCRIDRYTLLRKIADHRAFLEKTATHYIGVRWDIRSDDWRVDVDYRGHRYNFGFFRDLDEAAYIRDQVALQLHNNKAKLNILTGPSIPWPSQTVDAA